MVCAACEKKLQKVACPDKWKDGSSNTNESGRRINENKALSKAKRYSPYASKANKCKVCKSNLHQEGIYCHSCAYSKAHVISCSGTASAAASGKVMTNVMTELRHDSCGAFVSCGAMSWVQCVLGAVWSLLLQRAAAVVGAGGAGGGGDAAAAAADCCV
eukprot:gene12373-biopygen13623